MKKLFPQINRFIFLSILLCGFFLILPLGSLAADPETDNAYYRMIERVKNKFPDDYAQGLAIQLWLNDSTETRYISGNMVRMRNHPSVSEGIMGCLGLGMRLNLIDSTEHLETIAGKKSKWYQVILFSEGEGGFSQEGPGWIFGGFLTADEEYQSYYLDTCSKNIIANLKTNLTYPVFGRFFTSGIYWLELNGPRVALGNSDGMGFTNYYLLKNSTVKEGTLVTLELEQQHFEFEWFIQPGREFLIFRIHPEVNEIEIVQAPESSKWLKGTLNLEED